MILMADTNENEIIWGEEISNGDLKLKLGYEVVLTNNSWIFIFYVWTNFNIDIDKNSYTCKIKLNNNNLNSILLNLRQIQINNAPNFCELASISIDYKYLYRLLFGNRSYYTIDVSLYNIETMGLSNKATLLIESDGYTVTLTTDKVSNIINKLNYNFNILNEAFKAKKANANSLEDNIIKEENNIKIQDGAIDENKLAENSVGKNALDNNSVNSEKIRNGSITLEKFETTNLYSLYKKMLYTRGIYVTTNLYDTSFPVGSIVLYYRNSVLNNEDKTWFEGDFSK